MDTSVAPNQDFFNYVNGTWLKTNEIPADRTRWGSFDELRKKTDADALNILKSAMSENKDMEKITVLPGSDQEKAVEFFQTIMDTVSRDNQGIDPLKPYLAKIDNIKNIEDLQAYLIEMEPQGGAGFFGFGVGSHPKNSNLNTAYLGGGSLGLSRDYYVDQDGSSNATRDLCPVHIATMLRYIGEDVAIAKPKAVGIMDLETKIEETSLPREER